MNAIHSHAPDHSAGLLPPISVYSFVHGLGIASAVQPLLSLQDSLDEDAWAGLLSAHRNQGSDSDSLDNIILSFLAFNTSYSVTLARKTDLFADASEWLLVDDKPVSPTSLPSIYEGYVSGYPDSSTARMIMHTHESGNMVFEGSFTTPFDGLFNLKSVQSYRKSKRPIDINIASSMSRGEITRDSTMILFHDSGIEPPFLRPMDFSRRDDGSIKLGSACGISSDHQQYQEAIAQKQARQFDGQDLKSSANKLRRDSSGGLGRRDGTGVAGCHGTKQFVFMGAAADCNYVSAAGGTSQALAQILSDFNQASAVYEAAFQVGLAIIKVNLQTSCSSASTTAANGASMAWNQACVDGYSINNRLSDFSQWRGSKDGKTPDNAGLWHLMTGCTTAISGQAVGIAWLQTLCQQTTNIQNDGSGGSDYVSGTAVSSIVPVEWKVVAHEVGHNFGAIHDCTSGSCPQKAGSSVCCPCSSCDCGGQYLMHPTDNAVTSQFSECSAKYICQTLQNPERYGCLQPPNALQALTTNICGNGVKEAGEECDCGGPDCGKTDPCCNGATCKFTAGSVCDDQNDECCSQCQYKPQGVVCRPSSGVCDYAEVCDGKNGSCPLNLFAPNGQACSSGLVGVTGTTCANGVCTSRDQQCTTNSNGLVTTGVCNLPGSNTQCQLLCATKNGQCYILAGSMIDGTSCGYSGQCRRGNCEESSWFGSIIDLFLQNLQISVPIVSRYIY
ncbi:UNVERIFIED_CONTAM: hypothetical protein HDU68_009623 [Siphonaria sp. JEL0065]|nr:hypothetical protein HDU68_009623 [Siphonaria sp. JEL0065]